MDDFKEGIPLIVFVIACAVVLIVLVLAYNISRAYIVGRTMETIEYLLTHYAEAGMTEAEANECARVLLQTAG